MISVQERKGIFRNENLQKKFNEQGFVIVPFINDTTINNLNDIYKKCYPKGVDGFFSTTFANNISHREKVNRSIKEECLDRLNQLFIDYKVLFSSFIVKAPGKKSELIMHQDMTLVDENLFAGINVWCPMIDLDNINGAIEILPKSHRFFKTYRGSSIPDIYDNVVEEVKSLLVPQYLKAGEALIFDQSIIHYSPPNLSQIERPVINTFVAHAEAKIKICYWDKETYGNAIEIFEQEDDFLEKFENFGQNIFAKPTIGKSLGKVPYNFPKLDVPMLERTLGISVQTKENNETVDHKRKKHWFKSLFSSK